jgi:hypothetical protein
MGVGVIDATREGAHGLQHHVRRPGQRQPALRRDAEQLDLSSWNASAGSNAAIQRLASRTSTAQRLSSLPRSAARISVEVGFAGRPRVAAFPSCTQSSHCVIAWTPAGPAARRALRPARTSSGTSFFV